MKTLVRFFPTAALVASFLLLSNPARADIVSLDLINVVPQSPTYSGHAGTGNFGPDLAGLQYFNVSAQSGNSYQFPSALQLFCIELAQNIVLGSTGNLFTVVDAAQGDSGVGTGLGANIPVAGIGATRAASLEVLYAHAFGSNYNPTALSETERLGFQLATWELSHDDNFNLLSGSGNEFWVTSPGDAATAQAQALVGWVQANPDAPRMSLLALHSDSAQDFLVPTDLALIPEPSAYALLAGLGALGVVLRRRQLKSAH